MEETRKKLAKDKSDELKDKIKSRLAHEEQEELENDDELTLDDIAEEISAIKTDEELSEFLDEVHDVDIAEYLEEVEDDNELLHIFNVLNHEDQAAILESSDEDLQVRILNLIPEEEALDIFIYMSPDDIADILGFVGYQKSKSLLNKMKRSKANKLRELLGYDSESAGGIMTTQYIAFRKHNTVGDVLDKIKYMAPRTEYIETIFVLSDSGALMGEADLRDILISPIDTKLEEITEENIKYVYADEDQEEVARLVSKYGLKVVPVLNKRDKLLGIITIDDVVDVIQEENTEDILKLAGTADDEELTTPLFDGIKKRLPWLIINLGTAIFVSLTVGLFQNTINTVVALAIAMPIVSGMGGNAGTQGLAVTIRAIALGEYTGDDKIKLIAKYFIVGALSGAILGVAAGAVIYVMFHNIYISIVIFLAMIGDCIVGCVIGFLIPIVLKAFKIDPAVASSVVLTTVTDCCGFVFFLGIATLMLSKIV